MVDVMAFMTFAFFRCQFVRAYSGDFRCALVRRKFIGRTLGHSENNSEEAHLTKPDKWIAIFSTEKSSAGLVDYLLLL